MSDRRVPPLPFLLSGVLAVALVGWTVWWFVLAKGVERRLDEAAAGLRAAGYDVRWAERSVDGWPYRVRVGFDGFRIAAPSGHALAAPRLVAQANAYAPGKWVVAAPESLTLTRGAKGEVRITGRALRASVTAVGGAVPRVTVELAEPVFTPAAGAEPFPLASAKLVGLNLRSAGERDAELLLRIEDGAARKGGVLDWTVGGAPFDSAATARIANAASFSGPTWAAAARSWASRGGGLADVEADVIAGEARAEAAAPRLGFDADGRLNGTVTMDLRNGPAAIAALGRWDQVGSGAATAASGLTAAQSGLNGQARVVLSFEGGRARLGPVPLAPAPKLF